MDAALRRVVFRVGSHEYRWEDVVRAAEFWGEWAAVRSRVAAAAAITGELPVGEDAPRSDALAAAAEEFRYARDLLSAEELDAWLQHWDLSLDDWEAYLSRSVIDPDHIQSPADLDAYPHHPPSEKERAVWAEVVCSGAFIAWAERLATRAALWARCQEESPADGENDRGGPASRGPAAFRQLLQDFETAYDRLAASDFTPRGIADQIARRRADWTRVAGVLLTFDERDQAHEAAMLGREDREPPQVVAAVSGAAVREGVFFLDEFDPALRELLRSVAPNGWAGPFEAGDRFILLFVRERIPPLATDPDIRHRAARSLLETHARQEVSRRVTWSQYP